MAGFSSSETYFIKRKIEVDFRKILPLFLVFCLAFSIRIFRIGVDPLWFDEIYTVQVGQRGLLGLIKNSLFEPHPPLYYFITWLGTGFASQTAETVVRFIPALSGSLTIPVFYMAALLFVRQKVALLTSLLFAISPMHLYYSQEARSYALITLLAAVSFFLLVKIEREPGNHSCWIGMVVVTAAGFYSSYSYFAIAGIQLLFLAWRFFRRKEFHAYLATLAGLGFPLLFLLGRLVLTKMDFYSSRISMSPVLLFLSFSAGEPHRYGITWAHIAGAALTACLLLAGIVLGMRSQKAQPIFLYPILQVFVPLVLYFGLLDPLFRIHLASADTKQFLVLLPAVYMIVAFGFQAILKNLSRLTGLLAVSGASGVLVFACLANIQVYWSTSKSPEGLAVKQILKELGSEDALVSLHHSLTSALVHYCEEECGSIYLLPDLKKDSYYFQAARPENLLDPYLDLDLPEVSIHKLRDHSRIWVLARGELNQNLREALTYDCGAVSGWASGPFSVLLVENCSSN